MTALFDEPIKAWANGKQVLWLGVAGRIAGSPDIEGGYSLVNHTDGTTEWVPTKDIQTDWRYDDAKERWFDASFVATPERDGDPDDPD